MFKRKVDVEVDPETVKELEMAFKLYDDLSVGSISGSDVKSVIRAYGLPIKKANVRQLMKRNNLQYEDPVTLPSFIAIMGEILPKRNSKEHYERIFRYFDEEGKGKISPNSIIDVAMSIGQHISEEQVRSIFQRGDIDKDGMLNLQEFAGLINPTIDDQ